MIVTNTLARVTQLCFTLLMPMNRLHTTVARGRESIYDKAERILSDPSRVIESDRSCPPLWWNGQVVGDHGTYRVTAISEATAEVCGLPGTTSCNCRAGRTYKLCSHAIVGEEMRLRGEN